MESQNLPIGALLVESGLISEDILSEVLEKQKQYPDTRLGDLVVRLGYITESQLMHVLERKLKIPFVDLATISIDHEITKIIPEEIARKYNMIALFSDGNVLTVAISDPTALRAQDDVKLRSGKEISFVLAAKDDVRSMIDKAYAFQKAAKAAETINEEFSFEGLRELENESSDDVESAPVVRLVNSIIRQAYSANASDIHIEPMETQTRIRIRIDGQLTELLTVNKNAHNSIIVRLKIIGGMDIAERRLPQDGRVEMTLDGASVDFRLSILPTAHGEKAVIRILGNKNLMLDRASLGISPRNMEMLDKMLSRPNGIILVSGPTGSGKTTTLYSILRELNNIESNIVTVEDPVEYKIAGVNQMQINTKAGLTFATGLRSILRQDPDTIMVGEIRDSETAQIAVRAAITGHRVLSTIHTNDAASTVIRLVDMGIAPYLVSSSVVGVIAQRLVRKICPRCAYTYKADEHELLLLGLEPGEELTLGRGKGCPYCGGTGYKGRTAIHEIMVLDREMRLLIDSGGKTDDLRDLSKKSGTTTLVESCRELVVSRLTTIEEMVRVTYST